MKHYTDGNNTLNMLEAFSASARPTLSIDVAKYQHYLDESDLTPEQKEEFLQAMFSIVVTFVELGYGVHPLQEACGKDGDTDGSPPVSELDELGSGPIDLLEAMAAA